MVAVVDYAGIAAVIVATGSAVASVIAAILTSQVKGKVSTNGDPRELGQIVTDVAHKVGASRRGGEQPDGT